MACAGTPSTGGYPPTQPHHGRCLFLACDTDHRSTERERERDGRRQRGTLQLWERRWGISVGGCVLCGLLFPLSLARPPLRRVKRQLINQRLFFVAFSSRRRLLSLPCFAQQSVLSAQIFFPFIFPLFKMFFVTVNKNIFRYFYC
jgi:hypothetical protein